MELNLSQYPFEKFSIEFYLWVFGYWKDETLLIKLDNFLIETVNIHSGHLQLCNESDSFHNVIRISKEIALISELKVYNLVWIMANSEALNQKDKSIGIFGLNITLKNPCQSFAQFNESLGKCVCRESFYRRDIIDCNIQSFEEGFCFTCEPCSAFCKTCLSDSNCIECENKFDRNDFGQCVAPSGKVNLKN
jgi:hypothetical protein